jgi:transcriptional regulator with XRE-family HTH domain
MARQRVTQRALAAHLRLSQPQITKRLNGQIEFRNSELEEAAGLLGVPVTQFLPVTAASAA